MSKERNAQEAQESIEGFSIDTRGSRPGFFERNESDILMTALLETMSQLWVTKSRLENLEKAIVDKALLSPEEIKKVSLSEAEQAQRDEMLQNFLADAFRASGKKIQSLDARQRAVDRFQYDDADST